VGPGPGPAFFLLLGRKVASAFGGDVLPFQARGPLISIPHPSGRCLEWNDPAAVLSVRALLRNACPSIPWGELDQSE
jgi:hypothetical protein